jgi:hypothetical protein
MSKQLYLALIVAATCNPSDASEVYKWTDERGRIHYSDSVPEGKQKQAKGIYVNASNVTEADKKAAEVRLEKYKSDLARVSPSAASAPVPASAATFSSTRPKPKRTPCEAAWDAYNESYACFDPYRMAEGRVRPEAFQHCKQVNQPPEPCR